MLSDRISYVHAYIHNISCLPNPSTHTSITPIPLFPPPPLTPSDLILNGQRREQRLPRIDHRDAVVVIGAERRVGEASPLGSDAEAVEDLGGLLWHEGLQQDAGDAQGLGRRVDGAVDGRGIACFGLVPGCGVGDVAVCLFGIRVRCGVLLILFKGLERLVGWWVRMGIGKCCVYGCVCVCVCDRYEREGVCNAM